MKVKFTDHKLVLVVPLSKNGETILSKKELEDTLMELLRVAHIDWTDAEILEIALRAINTTSPALYARRHEEIKT